MGRITLILVLGFAIVLGITTRSITGRLAQAVTSSSYYYNKTRAKNISSSAAEIGLRRLKGGSVSIPSSNPIFSIMGGTATYTITSIDHDAANKPDTLKMITVAVFDSTYDATNKRVWFSDTVVNIIAGNISVNPPPMDGALTVSAGSKLNFQMSSDDSVSGYNHDLNGNRSSTCADAHGLVFGSGGYNTSSAINTQIKGVDAYVPDTFSVASPPNFKPLTDQLVKLGPDTIINSNPGTSPLTIGTLAKPQITLVNGGRTFHGPTTGAGILIVRPGTGTFQTSSTFKFTGIIFIIPDSASGKAQVTFGDSTNIIGGMVMQGSQAKLDVGSSGKVLNLEYSCEAINLAFQEPKLVGNWIVYNWWEPDTKPPSGIFW